MLARGAAGGSGVGPWCHIVMQRVCSCSRGVLGKRGLESGLGRARYCV